MIFNHDTMGLFLNKIKNCEPLRGLNNSTREVTYGVNTGGNLEPDVAKLTKSIDTALAKVDDASTFVTDIDQNKTDIKTVKDDYVNGIILNANRELEITDGGDVTTKTASIQGLSG